MLEPKFKNVFAIFSLMSLCGLFNVATGQRFRIKCCVAKVVSSKAHTCSGASSVHTRVPLWLWGVPHKVFKAL